MSQQMKEKDAGKSELELGKGTKLYE